MAKLIEFAQDSSQTVVSDYKFFSCCASCSTLIPSVSSTCVCVCVCVCRLWGGVGWGRGGLIK